MIPNMNEDSFSNQSVSKYLLLFSARDKPRPEGRGKNVKIYPIFSIGS
jgi:hypothetical protein